MTPRSSKNPPPFKHGVDGRLRREDFTKDRIDQLRALADVGGQEWLVTDEERDQSRAEMTKHLAKGAPVWIFAYGSLMWNPAMHVAVSKRAQIFGYHRSYCLNLVLGRGSLEKPGLMLGLDRGGSCIGVAHKIAGEHVQSELEILWMREMLGTTYFPKWLRADVAGKQQNVLTFIANREGQRYLGPKPLRYAAKRIAMSSGILGTNREYLYNTNRELEALGISDGPLHALEAEVRRIAKEPKAT